MPYTAILTAPVTRSTRSRPAATIASFFALTNRFTRHSTFAASAFGPIRFRNTTAAGALPRK